MNDREVYNKYFAFPICIIFLIVLAVLFYNKPNIESSEVMYQRLITFSDYPTIKPLISSAMSDGFVSFSEFEEIERQVKTLESSKLALDLKLKGNK